MLEVSDIQFEKISCIKKLWEKLNKLHYDDSVYFEDNYESFTFEKRIEKFKHVDSNNIKISLVKDGPRHLGYCISIRNDNDGGIESIYLENEIQGRGIGKKLISDHIKWLKENGCSKIRVAVSFGHEKSVTEFYHSLGFYERLISYELKDEG
jgi:GNAT superfamily N-acetyltransferase